MTTVLIDKTARIICADNQSTLEHDKWFVEFTHKTKIRVYEDVRGFSKVILVGAGDSRSIDKFEHNFINDLQIPRCNGECKVAVITYKSSIEEIPDIIFYDVKSKNNCFGKKTYYWCPEVVDGVITFGSGGQICYGAYRATNDYAKAMQTAGQCDKYTSLSFDFMKL